VKSTLCSLLTLGGLAAAMPALGANITFYEDDNYRGRSVAANQSVSNFADINFNDRASSVRVTSGTWQLCSDAHFRGRCITVSPGEYPTLRSMDLNDRVSSARELDWLGGGGAAGGAGGRIQMFDRHGFDGSVFVVDGAITNFNDVGFNDRAQSMIVNDGTWEACEHTDFRGSCQTFGPGRYANLGGLAGQISSIRAVGGVGSGPGGPGRGRVELFDGYQFDGRSFPVNATISNFSGAGFNDRAQSMIIRGGLWEVCEHADFRGSCQTFGPGRYPNLGAMAGRISSIRPVAGDGGSGGFGSGGWGSGSRALLYEGPNLTGRSFV
jgi:annotation not available